MRRFFLLIAVSAFATQASAQGAAPAAGGLVIPNGLVGGAAGMSFPTGRLAKSYSAGFNLSGLIELRAPTEAVGVRGEVLWEHFERKTDITTVPKNKDLAAFIVNAVYFVPGYALRPYFIGGMGFYHVSDQGNRPGLNFGMGLDIPLAGMSAHLEGRVHKPLTDNGAYVSVPISFGLRF